MNGPTGKAASQMVADDGIIEIRDPEINVEAIMERIRHSIRQRQPATTTTDEAPQPPPDSAPSFPLTAPTDSDGLPQSLRHYLRLANQFHDAPTAAVLPTSTRLGPLGWLWARVVLKVVNRLRAYVMQAFDLQVTFNSHAVRTLNEMAATLTDVTQRAEALAQRSTPPLGQDDGEASRPTNGGHAAGADDTMQPTAPPALAPSAATEPASASLPSQGPRPDPPTHDAIATAKQCLQPWSSNPDRADEFVGYLDDATERFLTTLDLLPPDAPLRVLELGSNPYFFTLLLEQERPRYTVEQANFFGWPKGTYEQKVYNTRSGAERTMRFQHFNVEDEFFPYQDAAFDGVICCEILEHLLFDPTFMLAEVHRILRPGGLLIITTPNVARQENLLRLEQGQNLYDPYSGYGAYGRHNREYTMAELRGLLKAMNYDVERAFTADRHATTNAWPQPLGLSGPADTPSARGENLYVLARARSPLRLAYPPDLYRSLVLAPKYPRATVGENDRQQFGTGWGSAEQRDSRWCRELLDVGIVYVRARGREKHVVVSACSATDGGAVVRLNLVATSAGQEATELASWEHPLPTRDWRDTVVGSFASPAEGAHLCLRLERLDPTQPVWVSSVALADN